MAEQLPYRAIEVPEELITDFRLYNGDTPEFNRLMEGTELGDEKIRLALQLWLHKFNNSPPITTSKYGFYDFPQFEIVFEGAMLMTLTMAGILHTRNFLNFNDGGVSFSVADKGQAYMQWIQMFMNKHMQDVMNVKVGINAEEAYGFIPSPEGWDYPYDSPDIY